MSSPRPVSPRPPSPQPPVNTKEAEQLLETLRNALHNKASVYATTHSTEAQATLSKLKVALTKFHLYPPFDRDPASAKKQLTIAREAYELGVVLSIHMRDLKAFQRNVAQLRPYYTDFSSLLPASPRQADVTGLHLLYLLSQNLLADFHSELELLLYQASRASKSAPSIIASPQVQYPIQLEQYLMEGCYHKVFDKAAPPPLPECAFFLDTLLTTVREKIAESSESAYDSYPLGKASRLLMFDDPAKSDDFLAFLKARGWEVQGDVVRLPKVKQVGAQVDQLDTIAQHLHYASELERIV